MLTLLPLNGLQAAFKRRNSKTYDFSRRGSVSVYSTYSLPQSRNSMRRFSSYEELTPIFQLLAQDGKLSKRNKELTREKQKSLKREASSSCADLDAQLAKIKGQLAQFKKEDLEVSQRVDDLSSSVEELYSGSVQVRQRQVSQRRPSSARSNSSLTAIHENHTQSDKSAHCDSDSDDEQDFAEYCKLHLPKLVGPHSPLSFTEFDFDSSASNPKDHCIPNNLLKPRAKSTPQLAIVRNDLSKHDSPLRPARLSMISCQSDSILFTSYQRRFSTLSCEQSAYLH